jgi:hypothetical protein
MNCTFPILLHFVHVHTLCSEYSLSGLYGSPYRLYSMFLYFYIRLDYLSVFSPVYMSNIKAKKSELLPHHKMCHILSFRILSLAEPPKAVYFR